MLSKSNPKQIVRSQKRNGQSSRKRFRKSKLYIQPQPNTGHTLLKLSAFDIYTMTSTVVPQTYSFRLNSLYDFDLTGTGKQPYLYDQYFPAIYNSYRVVSATIHLTIINSSINQLLVGGFPSYATSVANSDLNLYPQYPNCKYKVLTANLGVDPIFKFEYTCKIHDFLKLSKDSVNLYGNYNSNPATCAYFHVFSQALDYTTSSVIYFTVRVDFRLEAFNEIQAADS